MSPSRSLFSRRLSAVALALLVLAALAWVAIPIWKIRPFVPQTASGVALAYACRRWAPWAPLLTLAAGFFLSFRLWRGGRWWSRALLILALVPLAGAAWASRLNIFEKMFAPLTDPRFARAAEADWMKDGDLVLGVEHDGEAVAFPVLQLAYHHVVMDEVGGFPVVATY